MLHVATAIHEQLAHFRSTPPEVNLPHADWSYCVDILRRMRLAQERGWQHAAKRQQQCLAEQLTFLKDRLASLADTLAKPRRVPILASVAEIYRDLGSLSLEFDEVNWDLRDKTLSVHTEPITLGDVYLGPFEMQLDFRKMPGCGSTSGREAIWRFPSTWTSTSHSAAATTKLGKRNTWPMYKLALRPTIVRRGYTTCSTRPACSIGGTKNWSQPVAMLPQDSWPRRATYCSAKYSVTIPMAGICGINS
jgi:hypothetical protein